MNKTIDTELASLISKTTQGIDSSLLFAQKQLPDIIEQLITWNIYKHSIILVITIFIFFLLSMWAKRIKRLVEYNELEDEEVGIFIIGGIVGVVFFFNSLFNFIQLIIAPKIWLIEYAASLVKA